MVGNIRVRVVKQKGASQVVGVTASVVAQEAPEPVVDQEVAKEPEATKENASAQDAGTGGTEPEASKAPVVEPAPSATGSLAIELSTQAQRSPVNRAGENLFASSSMVRQSAAESVGRSLENALDQMFEAYSSQHQSVKSLVQVIF